MTDHAGSATQEIYKFDTRRKVVHLIRHAQGIHNLKYTNHKIRDPLLTPRGRRQCSELEKVLPKVEQARIELLVSSPLRRTLYTAIYALPSVANQIGILALPEAQETGKSGMDCDRGLDPAELFEEFKDHFVNFSLIGNGWNERKGLMASDEESLLARASWVRQWLRERDEQIICLVGHGGFLDYLVQERADGKDTGWKNCEWRTYELQAGAENGDAILVETPESKKRKTGED